MTLIIVLLACAFDRLWSLPVVWWRAWVCVLKCSIAWLERHLARFSFWQGPAGVALFCLVIPLFPGLLAYGIDHLEMQPLAWLFQFLVLVFCLLPRNPTRALNDYFHALLLADPEQTESSTRRLFEGGAPGYAQEQQPTVRFLLVEANRRLFAVVFWFVVLDIYGALLYVLVRDLRYGLHGMEGGFYSSLRDLEALLNWPVVRLLAMGFALAGNLPGAFSVWRRVDDGSIYRNENILHAVGGAALGLATLREESAADAATDETKTDTDTSTDTDSHDRLMEAQGLIHRTLFIGLFIIAIVVLVNY